MTMLSPAYSGAIFEDFELPPSANRAPSILTLLNPGRISRNNLLDLANAAERLGFNTLFVELGDIWTALQSGRRINRAEFAENLKDNNVVAVLGYTANGLTEWNCDFRPDGSPQSLFDTLKIPHLMFWTDHPQWANEKFALRRDLQPLLASPNCFHFLKSPAAAEEIHDILSWPNCYGLPVAENPDRLRPCPADRAQYDIVVLTGAPPSLPQCLEPFLTQDDPDTEAISRLVAADIGTQLTALWARQSGDAPRLELEELGREWVEARRVQCLTASHRAFRALEARFPKAAAWLRTHHAAYFDAVEALWLFGRWQRTFVTRYLARYFRVGVFGSDWSSVGLGPGAWVEHDDQPRVYGLGRIAMNVAQAGDEEGVAHKPFQIAACGVPMLHSNRLGFDELFVPGVEAMVFDSPRQARDRAAALLADSDKCQSMALAARQRLCRDHTWTHRLTYMLQAAGVSNFASTSPPQSS